MKIVPILSHIQNIPERILLRGATLTRIENLAKSARANEDVFQGFLLKLIILVQVYRTLINVLGSWFNYGMPKEQRKLGATMPLFIAALQIGIMHHYGKWQNVKSKDWARKLFKSLENDPKNHKLAQEGFRALLTLGITGSVMNKFVIPLISAPAGFWFREKFLNKVEAKDQSKILKLAHSTDSLNINTLSSIFNPFEKEHENKMKPLSTNTQVSKT